ncbi:glycosyltransferase family 9 protein [Methylomonas sp. MgM2]
MNDKRILIHLGSGMGNMLMATPMVKTLSDAGYSVDLCLQGETPNVETLFARCPFIRTVSTTPDTFIEQQYEIYVYGFEVHGSPIYFSNFKDAIILHPMWDWRESHNLHSEIELYTNIARLIAPNTETRTQPFCYPSERIFEDISKNTCVLIPGGGMQMIIRKWANYPALANHIQDVAVVGLPTDLDHSNRIVFPNWCKKLFGNTLNYQGKMWRFARRFADRFDANMSFPGHVKNYIGRLSLEDTAALINQAGYVIGNDCGLTHMAIALGKPVFPIIGPTSAKKVFPKFLDNVTVISKKYDCQPCQEKPSLGVWKENKTQCFCPYRLRCMDNITVTEVINTVKSTLELDAL